MEQSILEMKYKTAIQYATEAGSFDAGFREFAERFIALLGLDSELLYKALQDEEERRDAA
jgi:hypothetical protein